MKHFQTLCIKDVTEEVDPSDVAARPIEASDETKFDGIATMHKYDRDFGCRCLGR